MKKILPEHWDMEGLRKLLISIQNRKILVVGDVGVDRYTLGAVERISPEAPVPIVRVEEERYKLGLAANVADNVKALQGVPFLIGVIGRDRGAEDFRNILKQIGVSATHLVEDSTRRTVLKERIVSDRQQLLRVDYESTHAVSEEARAGVLDQVKSLLPQVDAVIVEDYFKGLFNRELVQGIIQACRQAGKKVLVDPHSKNDLSIYSGAYLIKPNKKETEELTGVKIQNEASLEKAAKVLLDQIQADLVVMTLGKDGMAIVSRQGEMFQVPTLAREVYDVSGAGDTVIATLALALGAGAPPEQAAILGNIAAGIEVGKRGTATVSPEEILAELQLRA